MLTPGNFEIEHVTMAPDRRQILFSSNQDDIDHRHLWKVGIESGPPVAVTKGDGIEWAPVFTADGKAIALLRSDARRPARPAIIMPNSPVRDLAPEAIPANFPSDTLVIPQQVIISAADGMKIHCQLFIHGDDDRNVPFSETVQMIAALRARRVETEQLIFPGEVHDFLTWASWLQAYQAAVSFFDRHLMKR